MTCQYSVLQFTPDPVAGELLNIGIVAWNADSAACKITNNWRRIRAIAGEKLESIQSYADQLASLANSWGPLSGDSFQENIVSRVSVGAYAGFRLTPPRASVKTPRDVVSAVSHVFLSIVDADRERRRTRATAIAIATRALKVAVVSKFVDETYLNHLVLRESVEGKFERHKVDLALRNGKVVSGSYAFSFESSDLGRIQKEVDATAWAIEDIRRGNSDVRLSVLTLPPTPLATSAYDRAVRLFAAMHVPVVTEAALSGWATSEVNELSRHFKH